VDEPYLSHHGILGMKWGIRRYQNPDGTWTEAGKKRYSKDIEKAEQKRYKTIRDKRHDEYSHHTDKLKSKIMQDELRYTKEFKEYSKAEQRRIKAEDAQRHGKKVSSSEWDRLGKDEDATLEKYNKKINEVYEKHKNEILSARLKDLKLPDTETYREFLGEHQKQKVSRLNMDESYYLQLFMP